MVIDDHAHACGVYRTCEGLVNYLNEQNIDKVILCGGEPQSNKDYNFPMLGKIFKGDRLEYFVNKIICRIVKMSNILEQLDEENKRVYNMSKEVPNRIMNAYWINPSENNCIEKMKSFYENFGFYMIKMHQCWTNFDIEDETVTSIMKYAREHRKIIFIHLLNAKQVKKLIAFANSNPENIIIIAHMIGGNEMINSLKSTNVYFDLSSPQLYSKRTLKRSISKFGINRFIAGSDTPYGKDNFSIVRKRLIEIGISESEVNNICGNNIKKLLNI